MRGLPTYIVGRALSLRVSGNRLFSSLWWLREGGVRGQLLFCYVAEVWTARGSGLWISDIEITGGKGYFVWGVF